MVAMNEKMMSVAWLLLMIRWAAMPKSDVGGEVFDAQRTRECTQVERAEGHKLHRGRGAREQQEGVVREAAVRARGECDEDGDTVGADGDADTAVSTGPGRDSQLHRGVGDGLGTVRFGVWRLAWAQTGSSGRGFQRQHSGRGIGGRFRAHDAGSDTHTALPRRWGQWAGDGQGGQGCTGHVGRLGQRDDVVRHECAVRRRHPRSEDLGPRAEPDRRRDLEPLGHAGAYQEPFNNV